MTNNKARWSPACQAGRPNDCPVFLDRFGQTTCENPIHSEANPHRPPGVLAIASTEEILARRLSKFTRKPRRRPVRGISKIRNNRREVLNETQKGESSVPNSSGS